MEPLLLQQVYNSAQKSGRHQMTGTVFSSPTVYANCLKLSIIRNSIQISPIISKNRRSLPINRTLFKRQMHTLFINRGKQYEVLVRSIFSLTVFISSIQKKREQIPVEMLVEEEEEEE
jgi:type II secretory pathway predicted ATPase ExeA